MVSGPRLVTWSERQLANSIEDLLDGFTKVLGVTVRDPEIHRQIAGVVAAGLTHPKVGAVRIVSPLDNPDLEEQVAAAIRPTLRFLEGTHPSRDIAALDAARAALRVVFPP
jgi:hypothetical protein